MPRLLHIQSSPSLENSVTRKLTERFVNAWTSSHRGFGVEILDLAADPLPHFDVGLPESTVRKGRALSLQDRNALSDKLIGQLERADVLVIGAPMINFTLCTQLKAWFDHVIAPGRTFDNNASARPPGLLTGKKAFVVEARGGDYGDVPMNAFDFQEPVLRHLLGFIGIHDITFVRAQGMRQRPGEVNDIMSTAEHIIDRLAS